MSAPHPRPAWDPAQYLRYDRERAQPFFDLIARLPAEGPDERIRRVADLGCGTGALTARLLERWPEAEIWGVDTSEEMLAEAAKLPASGRLHFVPADLSLWEPPAPCDRILSNAAIHWVFDHERLLARLAGLLAPEGVLAVQIPNNREEPVYEIARGLLRESPWDERVPGGLPASAVQSPGWYLERLQILGLEPEVWQTTYYHRLSGPDEVIGWIQGSTLRPVLSGLARDDAEEFLEELRRRTRPAYPAGPHGVVFPFQRLFFTGRKRGEPGRGSQQDLR